MARACAAMDSEWTSGAPWHLNFTKLIVFETPHATYRNPTWIDFNVFVVQRVQPAPWQYAADELGPTLRGQLLKI